jgi:UDP-glucuronate 4-epimerase
MYFVPSYPRPKILVTGVAGFIGMYTVLNLMQRNCDIVGIDNLNDYYSVELKFARLEQTGIFARDLPPGEAIGSTISPAYRFVKMFLQDRQAMAELFEDEKFDYVIHLAAQAGVRHSLVDPHSYIESNVSGFMNILESCRHFHIKHLVYASTSSVYGLNENLPFLESSPTEHPASLYAATKKSNELMAHSYSHLFQLPTTGLRFFTVYGPWGRPDMALFLFTKSIIDSQPIKIFNEGKMTRDFTYVDDVANAVTEIVFKPASSTPFWDARHPNPASSSAPYQIFNVGNSQPVFLMEYIYAIEATLNKKARKEYVPMQAGDITSTHADTSKIEAYLGYKSSVSIQHGVRKFVDWYQGYYGSLNGIPESKSQRLIK